MTMPATISAAPAEPEQYFAVRGSNLTDDEAQIVGPEIDRLSRAGTSSARQIMEAAKDVESPLHRFFEWDDGQAAVEYRKVQARFLCRAIEVEVVPGGKRIRPFVAVDVEILAESNIPFVPDGEQGESRRKQRHYIHLEIGKQRPAIEVEVMREARSGFDAWARRYQGFHEYFGEAGEPVRTAIDVLKSALEALGD